MDINERIRMIIETHRLNAGQFAEKIGVQRSNVSHILSGRNKPGYEFIEKVLLAFPRVQADWLITGRQSRVSSEDPSMETIVTEVAPEKPGSTSETVKTSKQIVKIVTFYSDYTFDTYLPNAE